MGGFWSGIAAPTNEPLGGPGACFPGIIFKICSSKMPFPTQSRGNPVHHCTRNYRRLMLRCHKGKNGWETTGKQQKIWLTGVVKQRKHNLSLARKSFKDQENIKQKRKAGNICRKWEVSGQNGRVGFSAFFSIQPQKRKGIRDTRKQSENFHGIFSHLFSMHWVLISFIWKLQLCSLLLRRFVITFTIYYMKVVNSVKAPICESSSKVLISGDFLQEVPTAVFWH